MSVPYWASAMPLGWVGPLSDIDMVGVDAFVQRCTRFEQQFGARYRPARLLRQMAEVPGKASMTMPAAAKERRHDHRSQRSGLSPDRSGFLIVLGLALFIGALWWRAAAAAGRPAGRRLAGRAETRIATGYTGREQYSPSRRRNASQRPSSLMATNSSGLCACSIEPGRRSRRGCRQLEQAGLGAELTRPRCRCCPSAAAPGPRPASRAAGISGGTVLLQLG